MELNEEKCAKLDNGLKVIFDEIAAELADALRNIKRIEKGVTQKESKTLAFYAAAMIRRAGEKCATCGIRAKGYMQAADSNPN